VRVGDERTLLTNGKFQGNDTGEVDAQRAFTQLPMLVQRDWGRALLIGVGTGCSLGVLAAEPFQHIDAVELSQDDLFAAAHFFSHINANVLSSPRVTTHVADGRNLLLLSTHLYDLIAIELSSIWFAGAADLYNRQFYALAKSRLSASGVLQQWVQLHHMTRRDLAVILQSIRAEYPHLALFYSGGQGIVLASAEPLRIDYAQLAALSERLRGSEATQGIPAGDLLTLHGKLLLDEQGVGALIAEEAAAEGVPVEALSSTDDSMRLEYSTPRSNADDSLDCERLIASLTHLSAHPLTVSTADELQALHVRAAWHVGREDEARARTWAQQLATLPQAAPLSAWLLR
jgi:spermidine synthase